MMLNAVAREGDAGQPWLVFLHGFSGDCREWQPVGEAFPRASRLYIDLPGHGGSADCRVTHFADVCAALQTTLLSYNILNYWLVGYSLGGRIAMTFACQHQPQGLLGVVVEGGHPGLQSAEQRAQRWQSDNLWAQRFAREPLNQVFDAWYRQPVFASLTPAQRDALVALRQNNDGSALAAMLLATSLSVQDDLREALRDRAFPFWYLCGERDSKFRAIADELAAPCHVIHNAGHNAHRENPEGVVACLAQIVHL